LIRIRDERLYREEYDTFEEFCKATLGKSKTYINNVIQGYELIQALIAQGETVLPDSERLALVGWNMWMNGMLKKRIGQVILGGTNDLLATF